VIARIETPSNPEFHFSGFLRPMASSANLDRYLASVTMLNIVDEVLEKLGSGFSH
jgi:hypothetical protein